MLSECRLKFAHITKILWNCIIWVYILLHQPDILYRNRHGLNGSKNIYLKFKRSDILLWTAIDFLISLSKFTNPLTLSPVDHILMTCNLSTEGAMVRRPKNESANVITNEWLQSYLEAGGGFWEVNTYGCFNDTSSVFYFQCSQWRPASPLICEMLVSCAAQRGHLQCEEMCRSCTAMSKSRLGC